MASDLGSSYKYKKVNIKYPTGDIYEGMAASFLDGEYDEPHGVGTYFHKDSGVTFKADFEWRRGPDFKTIEIIDKPARKSFVIVRAYASEIYSDLTHLDIIEAKEGTYSFKDLPSFILDPHAWSKHLLTIKKVTDDELVFDFTGPKVDHGNFVDKVIKKGEPQNYSHTISSHIIWDHDDEYDVDQTAKIDILYF